VQARQAPLVDPRAVVVDAVGNLYVLERSGHALRVVDPSGKIRTVAGTGKAGHSVAGTGGKGRAGEGGPALQAELNQPHGVYVDADGVIYIADSSNHRVVKIQP
jgi:DNA-binding beta-propeller fold protein YncE